MIYERELKALTESKARYVVIGGIAANMYGYPGGTFDLDLIVDLSEQNLDKIISTIKELGYIPRVPVNLNDLKDVKKREFWQKEKNMKAFGLVNPNNLAEHIDLLIYHTLDFEKVYNDKRIIYAQGIEVPIVSLEDLLKLKKDANRSKDKDAIAFLERLKLRWKDE